MASTEPEPETESGTPNDPRPALARVAADAAEWDANGRDASYLYRGAKLESVVQQLWPPTENESEPTRLMDRLTRDFLYTASEQAARRSSRKELVTALVATTAVLAVAAMGLAIHSRIALGNERDQRLAEDLITSSDEVLYHDGERAQLLAAAAWRLDDSDEAWGALTRSLDSPATGLFAGGHDGAAATDIAFSPDGSVFATGADDGSVALWDAETWQPEPLEGRMEYSVEDLEFSPDGRFLAAGGYDRQMMVWDVRTRAASELPAPYGTDQIAFDPTATRLVAGGSDGVISVWGTATMALFNLIDTGQGVAGLDFDATGERILVGGDDEVGRLYDPDSGEQVSDFALGPVDPFSGGIERRGFGRNDFLVCDYECWVSREADTDVWTSLPLAGSQAPAGAAFAGDTVVAAHVNGVGVWNAVSGELIGILPYPYILLQDIAISPDGDTVAAVTEDGVQRWSLDRMRRHDTLAAGAGHNGTTYTADGRYIVGTGLGGTDVWGASESGPPADRYLERPGLSIAAAPEGSTIATGLDAETARIEMWDAKTGDSILTFEDDSGPVTTLDFSPDGTLLASGSSALLHRTHDTNYGVILWDTETGQPVTRLDWDPAVPVFSVDFSADGTMLATLGPGGLVVVWDTATGEPLAAPDNALGLVSAVEFGVDGTSLIASTGTGIAEWLLEDLHGDPTVLYRGYYDSDVATTANYVAVGESYPDNDYEDIEYQLMVWDIEHGQVAAEIPVGSLPLFSSSSISFAPDGETLLYNEGGSMTRFDLGFLESDPYEAVCEQVGRDLTGREWEVFLPGLPYDSIDVC